MLHLTKFAAAIARVCILVAFLTAQFSVHVFPVGSLAHNHIVVDTMATTVLKPSAALNTADRPTLQHELAGVEPALVINDLLSVYPSKRDALLPHAPSSR